MQGNFSYQSLNDDDEWELFPACWPSARAVSISQSLDTTIGLGYECRVVRMDGGEQATVVDDSLLNIPKPRKEGTIKQFMQNYAVVLNTVGKEGSTK